LIPNLGKKKDRLGRRTREGLGVKEEAGRKRTSFSGMEGGVQIGKLRYMGKVTSFFQKRVEKEEESSTSFLRGGKWNW